MKYSWKWLRDYCAADVDPTWLADQLTLYGLEVEAATAVGDDVILEVEVVPVRADCLSHIGLAREIAVLTKRPLTVPPVAVREVSAARGLPVEVTVTAPDLCPRYSGRVVTGLRVAPSPAWLAERLTAVGVRALNNIVDITNFVNLERGQPLHAFDLAKVRGGKIIVRRADDGERLTLLNGQELTLTAEDLVIADADGPLALAGIMGGAESEVSAATEAVLIESAAFDAPSVRRTARRYGLTTESSYRFERGTDVAGTLTAADRAAALMAEIAHGVILAPAIDVGGAPPKAEPITLRPARANKLLGTTLSGEQMADLLRLLSFEVGIDRKENLVVTRPSFRGDVVAEVDAIEEIVRLYGYHNIAPTMPAGRPPVPTRVPREELERAAREFFVAAGFQEVTTPSFTSAAQLAACGIDADTAPALVNPVSPQFSHLRPALWPALAEVAARNGRAGAPGVLIFELGTVFANNAGGTITESHHLAALVAGEAGPRHWSRPAPPAGFFFLKGGWDEFARRLGAPTRWEDGDVRVGEGRGEYITCPLAPFGAAYVVEVDITPLYRTDLPTPRYKAIPRFPSVVRDLALALDERIPAADVVAAIMAASDLIRDVSVFDLFGGKGIPPGQKGLGIRVRYQADDRTLTDDEVNAAREETVKMLTEKFGATLRS